MKIPQVLFCCCTVQVDARRELLTEMMQWLKRSTIFFSYERSMSCEFTSFCHGAEYRQERLRQRRSKSARKKSVQWSNDLEEVRYFVPHRSRSESIRRKFNKVKKKAEVLRAFTLISESRVKQLRRNTNCFAHNSGFQTFEEYNKQWDLLFDIYTNRETH